MGDKMLKEAIKNHIKELQNEIGMPDEAIPSVLATTIFLLAKDTGTELPPLPEISPLHTLALQESARLLIMRFMEDLDGVGSLTVKDLFVLCFQIVAELNNSKRPPNTTIH